MRRSSKSIAPRNFAGNLYYLRLQTKFGPMYKLGFTSLASPQDRLDYENNSDSTLIDRTLLFVYDDEAYAKEQRLHRHFYHKRAFKLFSSDPALPLYQNGQSELYCEDILGMDLEFTAAQGAQTMAKLPSYSTSNFRMRRDAAEGKLPPGEVVIQAINRILIMLETFLHKVFSVDSNERIFTPPPQSHVNHPNENGERELLAWVKKNRFEMTGGK